MLQVDPLEDPVQLENATPFQLSVLPRLSGTWHFFGVVIKLHGLLQLFEHELYLPCPTTARVTPGRTARSDWRSLLRNMRTFDEKKGSHVVPTTGLSMELLELRDHAAGDPFKQIDWKASARMRKLIVRDYESELTLSVYLLLDISASMRWGSPGNRKLDFAVEMLSAVARSILTNRDRVGLLTFDHQIHSFVEARTGPKTYGHVLDALLDVNTVVGEPFTDETDEELIDRVGDYLRWQEGRDYRRQGDASIDELHSYEGAALGGLYDEPRIHRHISDALIGHQRLRSKLLHGGTALAESESMARLRLYCRLKGIDLSYRIDANNDKSRGLARALERVYFRTRSPHFIVVLTDGQGLTVSQEMTRLLHLLRRRHHRTLVLAPFGPDFEAHDPAPPLDQLFQLHYHEEQVRIAELRQQLGKRGVAFASCSPQAAVATMLKQLYQFRHAQV